MLDQIDKIANEYNKTKDPELKKLWYKKVKEWANGPNNIKRRIVSVSSVTKEMMEHISLLAEVDCMDLCEILRLKLTTYADSLNLHVMNDGSGNFYGCICK
jgi:hypothetical protein